MFVLLKIILISLLTFPIWLVNAEKIVSISNGKIEGTTFLSRSGRLFSAFMGIPYAKPPVRELRFRPPIPVENWNGVRNAKTYGPICTQPHYSWPFAPDFSDSEVDGQEDCLTINVFTPAFTNYDLKDKTGELPVLVFIHGGFFMGLSGEQFGPKYFLDHDIILVTFNYRVGALGFLTTNDEHAPGNYAMKDQLLALKWVQDNIHYLGGNKSRVTIYGESAGAAAVHYHLLSPASEGLFSAAISGSGVAFKVNSHQIDPINQIKRFAKVVGCDHVAEDKKEAMKCLRSLSADKIALNSDAFRDILKDPLIIYSPSVESPSTLEPFLTDHPFELMTTNLHKRVPWMVGVNSGEGLMVTLKIKKSKEWINRINSDWTDKLMHRFLYYNETKLVKVGEKINKFYLKSFSETGVVDFEKDFMGFTNLITDRYYIQASVEAAQYQSRNSPVFLYYNDYIIKWDVNRTAVRHAEEMQLLFSPKDLTDPIIDEGHEDYQQSKEMVDIWVQFVKDPFNVKYKEKLWNPLDNSKDKLNCLVLRNADRGKQAISTFPKDVMDRINFWKELGIKPFQEYENENPSKDGRIEL